MSTTATWLVGAGSLVVSLLLVVSIHLAITVHAPPRHTASSFVSRQPVGANNVDVDVPRAIPSTASPTAIQIAPLGSEIAGNARRDQVNRARESEAGCRRERQQPRAGAEHFRGSVHSWLPADVMAVYINRDKDAVRQFSMQAGLAGVWNATRISAVDGSSIENLLPFLAGTESQARSAVAQTDALITQKEHATIVKELSVTASHMQAVQRLASSNATYGLVLEDDVTSELLPYWTASLHSFIAQLPPGWRLVRLAYSMHQVHWEKVINEWEGEAAMQPDKVNLYGAVAYLLSRDGMDAILQHPFLSASETDGFSDARRLRMDVKKMPLYPCVVVDDCVLSPLLGAKSYIAAPPLLTFSDGIVLAKASTVRTDVKQLHYESRWFSLDWAAVKWEACTIGDNISAIAPNLVC